LASCNFDSRLASSDRQISVVGIWVKNSGLFVQEAVVHGVEHFAVHDFF